MIQPDAHIISMLKAVEFIETNLKNPLKVKDIADSVGYSLFYFTRIFNTIVRFSPYDYLMRRRIHTSARELIETDAKIIEIALEYQFNNHETFIRAFRRVFGITPKDFRKGAILKFTSDMNDITLPYLKHINSASFPKPEYTDSFTLELDGFMMVADDLLRTLSALKSDITGIKEGVGKIFYSIEHIHNKQYILGGTQVYDKSIPDRFSRKRILFPKVLSMHHFGDFTSLPLTIQYMQNYFLAHSETFNTTDQLLIEENITTGRFIIYAPV